MSSKSLNDADIWRSTFDSKGRLYYFNIETLKTSWECPEGIDKTSIQCITNNYDNNDNLPDFDVYIDDIVGNNDSNNDISYNYDHYNNNNYQSITNDFSNLSISKKKNNSSFDTTNNSNNSKKITPVTGSRYDQLYMKALEKNERLHVARIIAEQKKEEEFNNLPFSPKLNTNNRYRVNACIDAGQKNLNLGKKGQKLVSRQDRKEVDNIRDIRDLQDFQRTDYNSPDSTLNYSHNHINPRYPRTLYENVSDDHNHKQKHSDSRRTRHTSPNRHLYSNTSTSSNVYSNTPKNQTSYMEVYMSEESPNRSRTNSKNNIVDRDRDRHRDRHRDVMNTHTDRDKTKNRNFLKLHDNNDKPDKLYPSFRDKYQSNSTVSQDTGEKHSRSVSPPQNQQNIRGQENKSSDKFREEKESKFRVDREDGEKNYFTKDITSKEDIPQSHQLNHRVSEDDPDDISKMLADLDAEIDLIDKMQQSTLPSSLPPPTLPAPHPHTQTDTQMETSPSPSFSPSTPSPSPSAPVFTTPAPISIPPESFLSKYSPHHAPYRTQHLYTHTPLSPPSPHSPYSLYPPHSPSKSNQAKTFKVSPNTSRAPSQNHRDRNRERDESVNDQHHIRNRNAVSQRCKEKNSQREGNSLSSVRSTSSHSKHRDSNDSNDRDSRHRDNRHRNNTSSHSKHRDSNDRDRDNKDDHRYDAAIMQQEPTLLHPPRHQPPVPMSTRKQIVSPYSKLRSNTNTNSHTKTATSIAMLAMTRAVPHIASSASLFQRSPSTKTRPHPSNHSQTYRKSNMLNTRNSSEYSEPNHKTVKINSETLINTMNRTLNVFDVVSNSKPSKLPNPSLPHSHSNSHCERVSQSGSVSPTNSTSLSSTYYTFNEIYSVDSLRTKDRKSHYNNDRDRKGDRDGDEADMSLIETYPTEESLSLSKTETDGFIQDNYPTEDTERPVDADSDGNDGNDDGCSYLSSVVYPPDETNTHDPPNETDNHQDIKYSDKYKPENNPRSRDNDTDSYKYKSENNPNHQQVVASQMLPIAVYEEDECMYGLDSTYSNAYQVTRPALANTKRISESAYKKLSHSHTRTFNETSFSKSPSQPSSEEQLSNIPHPHREPDRLAPGYPPIRSLTPSKQFETVVERLHQRGQNMAHSKQQLEQQYLDNISRQALVTINPRSEGILKKSGRLDQDFTVRREKALERRENREELTLNKPLHSHIRANETFAPKLDALAQRQSRKSAYDLSEGERIRRERDLERKRKQLEEAELREATFSPSRKINRQYEPQESVLSQHNLNSEYLDVVRHRSQTRFARQMAAAEARERDEMAQCTFSPQRTEIPDYIRREADAHRLKKALRPPPPPEKPNWVYQ